MRISVPRTVAASLARKHRTSSQATARAAADGYPKIPAEMSGSDTLCAPSLADSASALAYALRSSTSSPWAPSIQRGPTAWTIQRASSPNAGVPTARPVGQGATASQAAASFAGPAALNIAPQTPPPASRRSFAALTMTSVLMSEISLRTMENGMRAPLAHGV